MTRSPSLIAGFIDTSLILAIPYRNVKIRMIAKIIITIFKSN